MNNSPLVIADQLTVSINNRLILKDLSFVIHNGDQWMITGDSGVGKTTLLHIIAGRQFYRGKLRLESLAKPNARVVMVEQQHHFTNLSNVANFYYQQRFNSSDAEDAITVREDLERHSGQRNHGDTLLAELIALFQLQPLMDERLIQLSNGENKRLQIAKALLDEPDILLLDNPFIGLDATARILLEELLQRVSKQGILIIMVSNSRKLPSFITHVLTLREHGNFSISPAASYSKEGNCDHLKFRIPDQELFAELLATGEDGHFHTAVKMTDVKISYHGKKILDGINWEVKEGERWSLSGPNGAGKSTLLSLITADNPQAYANDIYLFDRKRGTGETIWEIKRKIGYISPELHLHFEQSNNSFEVVASGLFDTIGLFRQLNDEQVELVNKWLKLLGVDKLKNKMLFSLSNSEQRMVLLARALVKNPAMLILDEPCQGLDEHQVQNFKELINHICLEGNKTLIYVSHYPEEIPACVNKFFRIENGKRVERSAE